MILHANNVNRLVYALHTIMQFLTKKGGNLRETLLL
jgi:hypothetical protein